MRIYILDDDVNVTSILETIIEHKNLGDIVGISNDSLFALEEIERIKPDIVVTDLLMPEIDGISLVARLKEKLRPTKFIMLSQVVNKDMVAKAYQAGVEFFISKPINAIEVETIIRKTVDKLEKDIKLSAIKDLFNSNNQVQVAKEEKSLFKVENVLKRIGLLGESGYQDILALVDYIITNDIEFSNFSMKELLSNFEDNPKSIEQRIRRTAHTGLVNLANIGIEDYMNDIFTEYANALYNFDQVRNEMNFIRGEESCPGKVNLKKFIEGLLFYSK